MSALRRQLGRFCKITQRDALFRRLGRDGIGKLGRIERLVKSRKRFNLYLQCRERIRLMLFRQAERNAVARFLRRKFRPRNMHRAFPKVKRKCPEPCFLFALPGETDAPNVPAIELVELIVQAHALFLQTIPLGIQRIPAKRAAVPARKRLAIYNKLRAKILFQRIFRACANLLCLTPVAAIVIGRQLPLFAEGKQPFGRHAPAQIQHQALFANIRRRNQPFVSCPQKRHAERKLLAGLSASAPEIPFKYDLPRCILRRRFCVLLVIFLGKAKLSVVKPGLHRMDIFPRLCHRAQVEGKHNLVERRELLVA